MQARHLLTHSTRVVTTTLKPSIPAVGAPESSAASESPEAASKPTLLLERRAHARLLLQQRGPHASRKHLAHAVARFLSLAALDTATFLLLRHGIRWLRDDAILGAGIAEPLREVFPQGLLGGINFPVALIVGLFVADAYHRGDSRRDPGIVARGVGIAVAMTLWTTLWSQPFVLVLAQGTIITAVLWCFLTLDRLAYEALVRIWFRIPVDGPPIVFVGDRGSFDAQRVHGILRGRPESRRMTSWVNVPSATNGEPGEPPVRTIERVHDALAAINADTLVLCGEFPRATFEAIVETATTAGVRVLSTARVSGVMQHHAGMVWYGGSPFVELSVPGFRGWQLILKRAIDFTLASIGVIVLSPLFAVVAVAIKLDSKGPVLFSQERVGYAGNVFRVFKFRTMRTSAEAEKAALAHLNASGDQRLFKIPNDPRITRLGAFLRRWSIDELPQLCNVVTGSMSLVGPRPFFEADLKGYLDHHFARLGAKPGITGLWQVKGRSSVTDFEEVVRLDREYIERWSVWIDLRIIARTLPAVLRGRGAY